MVGDLTEKQKAFCLEYYKNGYNATRAYLAVYHDIKNDNVAAVNSNRLLRNAKIVEYLTELKTQREKSAGISDLKVASELMGIAFSNMSDPKDKLRALKDLTEMFGYNEPEKKDVTIFTNEIPKIQVEYREPD